MPILGSLERERKPILRHWSVRLQQRKSDAVLCSSLLTYCVYYRRCSFCVPHRHIFGYLRTTLAAADRMDLVQLTYADIANSLGDADSVALNRLREQL